MASPRQKPFNALHSAWLFITILFCILLFYIALSIAGQFKVVRVTDFDTIKLRSAGSRSDITIRLVGIDAPEKSKKKNDLGQPFSQTATKHLSGLVLNKSVEIKSYGTDRYCRTLGVVYCNGKQSHCSSLLLPVD